MLIRKVKTDLQFVVYFNCSRKSEIRIGCGFDLFFLGGKAEIGIRSSGENLKCLADVPASKMQEDVIVHHELSIHDEKPNGKKKMRKKRHDRTCEMQFNNKEYGLEMNAQ